MLKYSIPVLVLVSVMTVPSVRAQRMEVHVTYVSSDYVYIDAGRDQDLHVGDSLAVFRADSLAGRVSVSGTSRNRSVTQFIGSPFPVSVGDTLFVEVLSRAGEPAPESVAAPPRQMRPSILEQTSEQAADRQTTRRRPRITGRVRFDFSAMRTETLWRSTVQEKTVRTFYSPTAALRLGVADLPGGWDVGLDLNVTRRFSTRDIVSPRNLARIYRISIRRSSAQTPFEIEAGRFQPDGDPQHSFWDGVQTTWRRSGLSAGIAVGLEPDRYNGFVQTGVPKAAAFVGAEWKVGAARLNSRLGGAFVRPTNGWLDHSYVGMEQDFRLGDARLSADLQMDQDPEAGGWTASRLYLRANVPLVAGLSLAGRYQERRPYAYWRSIDVVGTRRTQQALSLDWGGRALSLQAGWAGTRAEAGVATDSWSASFRIARLPFVGTSVMGSAALWHRKGFDSRYFTLGLSRAMAGGRVTATWQRYAFTGSPSYAGNTTTGLQWVGSIGRRLSASVGGRYQFGRQTRGLTANGSVAISF